MRCTRARQWMAAASDGELPARRQRALERHLERCAACGEEMAGTARLLAALDALPVEVDVPARLEQATLRRVRIEAAEEGERPAVARWWRGMRLPALALASAAMLAIAVGVIRDRSDGPGEWRLPGFEGEGPFKVVTEGTRSALADRASQAPRSAQTPAPRVAAGRAPAGAPPAEPPAALVAAPDLFMDLPILRNMEKLEHFDTITTLDGDATGEPGTAGRSNG